jgi:hypothetical protein
MPNPAQCRKKSAGSIVLPSKDREWHHHPVTRSRPLSPKMCPDIHRFDESGFPWRVNGNPIIKAPLIRWHRQDAFDQMPAGATAGIKPTGF